MSHRHRTNYHLVHLTGGGGLLSRMMAMANILLSFANLVTSLINIGRPDVEEDQRDEIHELRAENLRLKNEREFLRQGIDSNRIVELDQKIELNQLKIAREKWAQQNMGVSAPEFKAQDYNEPGDVRRGKYE